jgi:hypothetical protein
MARWFLLAFCGLLLASICGAEPCKSGYTTTVVVVDRDGKPISNVSVTIGLSCGDQSTETRRTDSQGEAIFDHSLTEITNSAVNSASLNGLSIDSSACTGDEKKKRCVIRQGEDTNR